MSSPAAVLPALDYLSRGSALGSQHLVALHRPQTHDEGITTVCDQGEYSSWPDEAPADALFGDQLAPSATRSLSSHSPALARAAATEPFPSTCAFHPRYQHELPLTACCSAPAPRGFFRCQPHRHLTTRTSTCRSFPSPRPRPRGQNGSSYLSRPRCSTPPRGRRCCTSSSSPTSPRSVPATPQRRTARRSTTRARSCGRRRAPEARVSGRAAVRC
mgnify:CR=1 FL=1